jgi:hypothetical protein
MLPPLEPLRMDLDLELELELELELAKIAGLNCFLPLFLCLRILPILKLLNGRRPHQLLLQLQI